MFTKLRNIRSIDADSKISSASSENLSSKTKNVQNTFGVLLRSRDTTKAKAERPRSAFNLKMPFKAKTDESKVTKGGKKTPDAVAEIIFDGTVEFPQQKSIGQPLIASSAEFRQKSLPRSMSADQGAVPVSNGNRSRLTSADDIAEQKRETALSNTKIKAKNISDCQLVFTTYKVLPPVEDERVANDRKKMQETLHSEEQWKAQEKDMGDLQNLLGDLQEPNHGEDEILDSSSSVGPISRSSTASESIFPEQQTVARLPKWQQEIIENMNERTGLNKFPVNTTAKKHSDLRSSEDILIKKLLEIEQERSSSGDPPHISGVLNSGINSPFDFHRKLQMRIDSTLDDMSDTVSVASEAESQASIPTIRLDMADVQQGAQDRELSKESEAIQHHNMSIWRELKLQRNSFQDDVSSAIGTPTVISGLHTPASSFDCDTPDSIPGTPPVFARNKPGLLPQVTEQVWQENSVAQTSLTCESSGADVPLQNLETSIAVDGIDPTIPHGVIMRHNPAESNKEASAKDAIEVDHLSQNPAFDSVGNIRIQSMHFTEDEILSLENTIRSLSRRNSEEESMMSIAESIEEVHDTGVTRATDGKQAINVTVHSGETEATSDLKTSSQCYAVNSGAVDENNNSTVAHANISGYEVKSVESNFVMQSQTVIQAERSVSSKAFTAKRHNDVSMRKIVAQNLTNQSLASFNTAPSKKSSLVVQRQASLELKTDPTTADELAIKRERSELEMEGIVKERLGANAGALSDSQYSNLAVTTACKSEILLQETSSSIYTHQIKDSVSTQSIRKHVEECIGTQVMKKKFFSESLETDSRPDSLLMEIDDFTTNLSPSSHFIVNNEFEAEEVSNKLEIESVNSLEMNTMVEEGYTGSQNGHENKIVGDRQERSPADVNDPFSIGYETAIDTNKASSIVEETVTNVAVSFEDNQATDNETLSKYEGNENANLLRHFEPQPELAAQGPSKTESGLHNFGGKLSLLELLARGIDDPHFSADTVQMDKEAQPVGSVEESKEMLSENIENDRLAGKKFTITNATSNATDHPGNIVYKSKKDMDGQVLLKLSVGDAPSVGKNTVSQEHSEIKTPKLNQNKITFISAPPKSGQESHDTMENMLNSTVADIDVADLDVHQFNERSITLKIESGNLEANTTVDNVHATVIPAADDTDTSMVDSSDGNVPIQVMVASSDLSLAGESSKRFVIAGITSSEQGRLGAAKQKVLEGKRLLTEAQEVSSTSTNLVHSMPVTSPCSISVDVNVKGVSSSQVTAESATSSSSPENGDQVTSFSAESVAFDLVAHTTSEHADHAMGARSMSDNKYYAASASNQTFGGKASLLELLAKGVVEDTPSVEKTRSKRVTESKTVKAKEKSIQGAASVKHEPEESHEKGMLLNERCADGISITLGIAHEPSLILMNNVDTSSIKSESPFTSTSDYEVEASTVTNGKNKKEKNMGFEVETATNATNTVDNVEASDSGQQSTERVNFTQAKNLTHSLTSNLSRADDNYVNNSAEIIHEARNILSTESFDEGDKNEEAAVVVRLDSGIASECMGGNQAAAEINLSEQNEIHYAASQEKTSERVDISTLNSSNTLINTYEHVQVTSSSGTMLTNLNIDEQNRSSDTDFQCEAYEDTDRVNYGKSTSIMDGDSINKVLANNLQNTPTVQVIDTSSSIIENKEVNKVQQGKEETTNSSKIPNSESDSSYLHTSDSGPKVLLGDETCIETRVRPMRKLHRMSTLETSLMRYSEKQVDEIMSLVHDGLSTTAPQQDVDLLSNSHANDVSNSLSSGNCHIAIQSEHDAADSSKQIVSGMQYSDHKFNEVDTDDFNQTREANNSMDGVERSSGPSDEQNVESCQSDVFDMILQTNSFTNLQKSIEEAKSVFNIQAGVSLEDACNKENNLRDVSDRQIPSAVSRDADKSEPCDTNSIITEPRVKTTTACKDFESAQSQKANSEARAGVQAESDPIVPPKEANSEKRAGIEDESDPIVPPKEANSEARAGIEDESDPIVPPKEANSEARAGIEAESDPIVPPKGTSFFSKMLRVARNDSEEFDFFANFESNSKESSHSKVPQQNHDCLSQKSNERAIDLANKMALPESENCTSESSPIEDRILPNKECFIESIDDHESIEITQLSSTTVNEEQSNSFTTPLKGTSFFSKMLRVERSDSNDSDFFAKFEQPQVTDGGTNKIEGSAEVSENSSENDVPVCNSHHQPDAIISDMKQPEIDDHGRLKGASLYSSMLPSYPRHSEGLELPQFAHDDVTIIPAAVSEPSENASVVMQESCAVISDALHTDSVHQQPDAIISEAKQLGIDYHGRLKGASLYSSMLPSYPRNSEGLELPEFAHDELTATHATASKSRENEALFTTQESCVVTSDALSVDSVLSLENNFEAYNMHHSVSSVELESSKSRDMCSSDTQVESVEQKQFELSSDSKLLAGADAVACSKITNISTSMPADHTEIPRIDATDSNEPLESTLTTTCPDVLLSDTKPERLENTITSAENSKNMSLTESESVSFRKGLPFYSTMLPSYKDDATDDFLLDRISIDASVDAVTEIDEHERPNEGKTTTFLENSDEPSDINDRSVEVDKTEDGTINHEHLLFGEGEERPEDASVPSSTLRNNRTKNVAVQILQSVETHTKVGQVSMTETITYTEVTTMSQSEVAHQYSAISTFDRNATDANKAYEKVMQNISNDEESSLDVNNSNYPVARDGYPSSADEPNRESKQNERDISAMEEGDPPNTDYTLHQHSKSNYETEQVKEHGRVSSNALTNEIERRSQLTDVDMEHRKGLPFFSTILPSYKSVGSALELDSVLNISLRKTEEINSSSQDTVNQTIAQSFSTEEQRKLGITADETPFVDGAICVTESSNTEQSGASLSINAINVQDALNHVAHEPMLDSGPEADMKTEIQTFSNDPCEQRPETMTRIESHTAHDLDQELVVESANESAPETEHENVTDAELNVAEYVVQDISEAEHERVSENVTDVPSEVLHGNTSETVQKMSRGIVHTTGKVSTVEGTNEIQQGSVSKITLQTLQKVSLKTLHQIPHVMHESSMHEKEVELKLKDMTTASKYVANHARQESVVELMSRTDVKDQKMESLKHKVHDATMVEAKIETSSQAGHETMSDAVCITVPEETGEKTLNDTNQYMMFKAVPETVHEITTNVSDDKNSGEVLEIIPQNVHTTTPPAVVNETIPQAVVDETTPQAVVNETTPQAVVNETEPQAVVNETTPQAVVNETTPQAVVNETLQDGKYEGVSEEVETLSDTVCKTESEMIHESSSEKVQETTMETERDVSTEIEHEPLSEVMTETTTNLVHDADPVTLQETSSECMEKRIAEKVHQIILETVHRTTLETIHKTASDVECDIGTVLEFEVANGARHEDEYAAQEKTTPEDLSLEVNSMKAPMNVVTPSAEHVENHNVLHALSEHETQDAEHLPHSRKESVSAEASISKLVKTDTCDAMSNEPCELRMDINLRTLEGGVVDDNEGDVEIEEPLQYQNLISDYIISSECSVETNDVIKDTGDADNVSIVMQNSVEATAIGGTANCEGKFAEKHASMEITASAVDADIDDADIDTENVRSRTEEASGTIVLIGNYEEEANENESAVAETAPDIGGENLNDKSILLSPGIDIRGFEKEFMLGHHEKKGKLKKKKMSSEKDIAPWFSQTIDEESANRLWCEESDVKRRSFSIDVETEDTILKNLAKEEYARSLSKESSGMTSASSNTDGDMSIEYTSNDVAFEHAPEYMETHDQAQGAIKQEMTSNIDDQLQSNSYEFQSNESSQHKLHILELTTDGKESGEVLNIDQNMTNLTISNTWQQDTYEIETTAKPTISGDKSIDDSAQHKADLSDSMPSEERTYDSFQAENFITELKVDESLVYAQPKNNFKQVILDSNNEQMNPIEGMGNVSETVVTAADHCPSTSTDGTESRDQEPPPTHVSPGGRFVEGLPDTNLSEADIDDDKRPVQSKLLSTRSRDEHTAARPASGVSACDPFEDEEDYADALVQYREIRSVLTENQAMQSEGTYSERNDIVDLKTYDAVSCNSNEELCRSKIVPTAPITVQSHEDTEKASEMHLLSAKQSLDDPISQGLSLQTNTKPDDASTGHKSTADARCVPTSTEDVDERTLDITIEVEPSPSSRPSSDISAYDCFESESEYSKALLQYNTLNKILDANSNSETFSSTADETHNKDLRTSKVEQESEERGQDIEQADISCKYNTPTSILNTVDLDEAVDVTKDSMISETYVNEAYAMKDEALSITEQTTHFSAETRLSLEFQTTKEVRNNSSVHSISSNILTSKSEKPLLQSQNEPECIDLNSLSTSIRPPSNLSTYHMLEDDEDDKYTSAFLQYTKLTVDQFQKDHQGSQVAEEAVAVTSGDIDLTATTREDVDLTATTREDVGLTATTREGVDLTTTTGEGVDLTTTTGEGVDLTTTTGEGVDLTTTTGEGVDLTTTSGEGVDLTTTTGEDVGLTATTSEDEDLTTIAGEGVDLTTTTGEGVDLTTTTGEGVYLTTTTGEGVGLTATTGKDVDLTATTGEGIDLTTTAGEGVDLTTTTGECKDLTTMTSGSVNVTTKTGERVDLENRLKDSLNNQEHDIYSTIAVNAAASSEFRTLNNQPRNLYADGRANCMTVDMENYMGGSKDISKDSATVEADSDLRDTTLYISKLSNSHSQVIYGFPDDPEYIDDVNARAIDESNSILETKLIDDVDFNFKCLSDLGEPKANNPAVKTVSSSYPMENQVLYLEPIQNASVVEEVECTPKYDKRDDVLEEDLHEQIKTDDYANLGNLSTILAGNSQPTGTNIATHSDLVEMDTSDMNAFENGVSTEPRETNSMQNTTNIRKRSASYKRLSSESVGNIESLSQSVKDTIRRDSTSSNIILECFSSNGINLGSDSLPVTSAKTITEEDATSVMNRAVGGSLESRRLPLEDCASYQLNIRESSTALESASISSFYTQQESAIQSTSKSDSSFADAAGENSGRHLEYSSNVHNITKIVERTTNVTCTSREETSYRKILVDTAKISTDTRKVTFDRNDQVYSPTHEYFIDTVTAEMIPEKGVGEKLFALPDTIQRRSDAEFKTVGSEKTSPFAVRRASISKPDALKESLEPTNGKSIRQLNREVKKFKTQFLRGAVRKPKHAEIGVQTEDYFTDDNDASQETRTDEATYDQTESYIRLPAPSGHKILITVNPMDRGDKGVSGKPCRITITSSDITSSSINENTPEEENAEEHDNSQPSNAHLLLMSPDVHVTPSVICQSSVRKVPKVEKKSVRPVQNVIQATCSTSYVIEDDFCTAVDGTKRKLLRNQHDGKQGGTVSQMHSRGLELLPHRKVFSVASQQERENTKKHNQVLESKTTRTKVFTTETCHTRTTSVSVEEQISEVRNIEALESSPLIVRTEGLETTATRERPKGVDRTHPVLYKGENGLKTEEEARWLTEAIYTEKLYKSLQEFSNVLDNQEQLINKEFISDLGSRRRDYEHGTDIETFMGLLGEKLITLQDDLARMEKKVMKAKCGVTMLRIEKKHYEGLEHVQL